jgi:glycyl-tRNA synthetase beta chain
LQALAVLFKRVKNIAPSPLRAPQGRPEPGRGTTGSGQVPGQTAGAALDREVLVEPAEQALLNELDARRPAIEHAAATHGYRKAFTEIAALRAPVDRFFTDVFVMADDPRLRSARLALMADLRDLILDLADISEIVPQTE